MRRKLLRVPVQTQFSHSHREVNRELLLQATLPTPGNDKAGPRSLVGTLGAGKGAVANKKFLEKQLPVVGYAAGVSTGCGQSEGFGSKGTSLWAPALTSAITLLCFRSALVSSDAEDSCEDERTHATRVLSERAGGGQPPPQPAIVPIGPLLGSCFEVGLNSDSAFLVVLGSSPASSWHKPPIQAAARNSEGTQSRALQSRVAIS